MDVEKYNSSITLLCSTCGCDQFEFEGGDYTVSVARCAGCGREFIKDDLIDENKENIHLNVNESIEKLKKYLVDEMRISLRKSIGNSKFIKIK